MADVADDIMCMMADRDTVAMVVAVVSLNPDGSLRSSCNVRGPSAGLEAAAKTLARLIARDTNGEVLITVAGGQATLKVAKG
jgi:hypothetical protein